MIAAEQHLGHLQVAVVPRPREVRMVEASIFPKRIFERRAFVTECTRQEPDTSLENGQGGELAAGEHVVANRQGLDRQQFEDALIEALVATADEHDGIEVRELLCRLLTEGLARGAEGELAMFAPALLDPLHAFNDRFGLQDHARAAPEGTVIHGAVPIPRPIAKVDELHLAQTLLPGDSEDSCRQIWLEGLGKEGEYGKERQGTSLQKAQQVSSGPKERQD